MLKSIILTTALFSATVGPVRADDTADIAAVFDTYVQGFAKGDLKLMETAFLPDGHFYRINPETGKVDSIPFKSVLPGWTARPTAGTSGSVAQITIVEDNMAIMIGSLQLGSRKFHDSFQLYKLNGRWLIVSKTTKLISEN